jgi:hypothetical protein
MKRALVALSLLALPLLGSVSACSDGAATSGDSNTDSQVDQPPEPGESDGGVPQGASASPSS